MFAQTLLPVLAVFGVAAAQTSNLCSQSTITINSQADATAIASCSTIEGDVVIGPTASGIIQLDGPQQIKGDLSCDNAGNLIQLSSTTLGSVGGTFHLFNLTLLSTLSMGALTSAKAVQWISLPQLPSLVFGGPLSKADSVEISNTRLNTLSGINLSSVKTLKINNNNSLKQFDTQVGNITELLDITANGNQLKVTFPNLIWAANMIFRNTSTVTMQSLATVNGSLGFYGNAMEDLMAPNLTSVGNFATGVGSLAIVANGKLANISYPMLKSVGGALQISNNTNLNSISFPSLATVGGAIDFSGNFTTPELPKLENVKGGFNVQSRGVVDCSGFKSQSGGKGSIIQGTFTCKGEADTVSSLDGTPTGSGSKTSATPKGAASSFGVSSAVAGLSVIGGLAQMLL